MSSTDFPSFLDSSQRRERRSGQNGGRQRPLSIRARERKQRRKGYGGVGSVPWMSVETEGMIAET